jgi:hypothetical protein
MLTLHRFWRKIKKTNALQHSVSSKSCRMPLNVMRSISIAIAAFALPDEQIIDGFTVANASLRRQIHIFTTIRLLLMLTIVYGQDC